MAGMRHIDSNVHLSVREGFTMPHKPPQKGECLPPHQPTDMTRRLVVCGKENGFSNVQIARTLDICEKTLTKHYQKELDCGKEVSILKATDRFKQAFLFNDEMLEKDPKVVASSIQFYLKTKGGNWKETQVVEQETTHKVDDGTLEKMKSLDIDDLINLGKGLEKSEG